MVFLIHKMRSHPKLTRFKIVVVTDRIDLEDQLSKTAQLTGENLSIVRRKGDKSALDVLQATLSQKGKDLVFAMIQKYRGEKIDSDGLDDAAVKTKPLPVLNTDEEILVMVDEAHRSHSSSLHANLLRAMPNAARIGWTGTPIMMGDKKKTRKIFGDFIDTYTIKQSEADGSTVRILYEGRTTSAILSDGRAVDELFPDMLADYTDEERATIQAKYATKSDVMEAPKLIGAKARDMLQHYVENILRNGFKAQVVAVSRKATIRYYEALRKAQEKLVEELENLDPELVALPADVKAEIEGREGFLARAYPYLSTIRELEFAPVISGGHNNDPVDPAGEWSTRSKIDERIERFKKPLFLDEPSQIDERNSDENKTDPLAFLIVRTMLLTGFDAPVEQVMYLDRPIKEAELLQAIARVNRTREGKTKGYVVDYYGVTSHLKEALEVYNDADVEGALYSFKDEIPKLRDRHRRALDVLHDEGIESIDTTEDCVAVLRDEKVRAEFHVHLKNFLATLDEVLPRPEGVEFVNDAKQLAHIQARARNRYRSDERLIGKEVGAKVRRLIDEHVEAQGIDTKIAPIAMTDTDFDKHVDKQVSPRAKASEMEHALRHHIRKHLDEDPVHYTELSERLEQILSEMSERWEEQVEIFGELIKKAKEGRDEEDSVVDPVYAPFYAYVENTIVGDAETSEQMQQKLVDLTIDLVDHIRQEISIVNFWRKTQARDTLRGWIFKRIDESMLIEFDDLDRVATELMTLAKANHRKLTRGS
jgi:type I restriction enzyme R subunit